ncbi:MAG: helix-turn-helix transcriptional regulator [Firmicutes bacterium]|nr:helix-turn-helix transcriptional regulator [Bacillota bacterium]
MIVSLKAARVNANLTQNDVAKAIGVDKSTIISWEKGRTAPTLSVMQRLCRLYKASIDDIFLPNQST